MKPLNTVEIDYLIKDCSFLIGAELQSVLGSSDIMSLKLWKKGPYWLTFNLSKNKPFFLAFEGRNLLDQKLCLKAVKKPLSIFLQTHFKGKKILKIERLTEYGRVLRFYFGQDEKTLVSQDLYIEFRAYPGGLNLGAVQDKKKVYWGKPLNLERSTGGFRPTTVRSPAVILEEGVEFFNRTNLQKNLETSKNQGLVKLQTAIAKIKEGLEFLNNNGYKKFAEKLENSVLLEANYKKLYRDNLTVRENIEWAYEQQKLKAFKIERLKERLNVLARQLEHKEKTSKPKKSSNLGVTPLAPEASRKKELAKNLFALCGRSAKENMQLLRRAKSWHIWMHLKDYPSGHLILSSPKGYQVSEKDLRESALFLFKFSAPKKLHMADKVKFEVIYTESKFVRPIKGAKLGLVQPSRTKSRVYEWTKIDQVKA